MTGFISSPPNDMLALCPMKQHQVSGVALREKLRCLLRAVMFSRKALFCVRWRQDTHFDSGRLKRSH